MRNTQRNKKFVSLKRNLTFRASVGGDPLSRPPALVDAGATPPQFPHIYFQNEKYSSDPKRGGASFVSPLFLKPHG